MPHKWTSHGGARSGPIPSAAEIALHVLHLSWPITDATQMRIHYGERSSQYPPLPHYNYRNANSCWPITDAARRRITLRNTERFATLRCRVTITGLTFVLANHRRRTTAYYIPQHCTYPTTVPSGNRHINHCELLRF